MITKLKRYLFNNSILQRELSEKTGIPRSTLSLICTGGLFPTFEHKKRISEALQKPINELFYEVEELYKLSKEIQND